MDATALTLVILFLVGFILVRDQRSRSREDRLTAALERSRLKAEPEAAPVANAKVPESAAARIALEADLRRRLEENLTLQARIRDLEGRLEALASGSSAGIARLSKNLDDCIDGLTGAVTLLLEARSPALAGHCIRVAEMTAGLMAAASAAGTGPFAGVSFSEAEIREARCAALLHDVGLLGTAPGLLERAGECGDPLGRASLTVDERAQVASHAFTGYLVLSRFPWPPVWAQVPAIVLAHHERNNGGGYPRQLRSPLIPLQSRFLAIADAFDSLAANDSAHRKALPVAAALAVLEEAAGSGTLDLDAVRLFTGAGIHRCVPGGAPAVILEPFGAAGGAAHPDLDAENPWPGPGQAITCPTCAARHGIYDSCIC